ncbi:MAG: hypothetical protein ABI042_16480 [Verrucomicrobiota bacterium]
MPLGQTAFAEGAFSAENRLPGNLSDKSWRSSIMVFEGGMALVASSKNYKKRALKKNLNSLTRHPYSFLDGQRLSNPDLIYFFPGVLRFKNLVDISAEGNGIQKVAIFRRSDPGVFVSVSIGKLDFQSSSRQANEPQIYVEMRKVNDYGLRT